MAVFIKILVCAGMMLMCCHASAQTDPIYLSASETDPIYLSTAQTEDLFISQNIRLIAEKLKINIADAAIMQAKLWSNPTFSIQDVNLWSTKEQRSGENGAVPPLFGSFGRNTQFALGLEQVIVLGGKRQKLVEMEYVTRDIAIQYFEELLRSLKVELRNAYNEMLFNQEYLKTLEKQREMLNALIGNYRNQVKHGNVSRSELLRLQASLLEVCSEINDLQKDINQQQKSLKTLLNISTPSDIVLTTIQINTKSPEEFSYGHLFELAEASRPDLKEAMFQKDFSEKSLRYEIAQRTPDLTLNATYNRAGGITPNVIAFGASIDLPLLNRNQGNIKAAQIGVQQNQLFAEQKQLEIRNEVIHALQNYTLAYNFNRQITGEFIADLDEMLESYTRNFINKNIGIVEFLDFFEAWKNNKRTMLSAQKDVKISFEELKYAVGTEL